jgi:hypothetical protein
VIVAARSAEELGDRPSLADAVRAVLAVVDLEVERQAEGMIDRGHEVGRPDSVVARIGRVGVG